MEVDTKSIILPENLYSHFGKAMVLDVARKVKATKVISESSINLFFQKHSPLKAIKYNNHRVILYESLLYHVQILLLRIPTNKVLKWFHDYKQTKFTVI